jgi:hypothetical protein
MTPSRGWEEESLKNGPQPLGRWALASGFKQNVAFESASCGDMIDAGTFDAFLADIQAATIERCTALTCRP